MKGNDTANTNLRVLLIHPPAETFKLDSIPLGLAYIASVAREKKHKVRVVELDPSFTKEELEKIVAEFAPEVVGISAMTLQIVQAFKAADFVKDASPGVITVLGGAHVSALPDLTLNNPHIDVIVHGEGDETFGQLLDCLSSGKDFKNLEGTGYRENGKLIINPPRALLQNLDRIPSPALDLFDYTRYNEGSMISSRGCPFRCIFCAASVIHGHKLRFASAQRVVDEMELLVKKYHYDHVRFWDDTFTANKKRVGEICDEILKRRLPVTWSCYAHVVTLDEELLAKMKQAGCCYLEFGIESGSPRIQKILNKNLNLESVKRTIEQVHKAGLGIKTDFMLGAPDETKEEIYQSLKLAIDLDPDVASFAILMPYPGTPLYSTSYGDGPPEGDWNRFIHSPLYAKVTDDSSPLVSKHLSREELDRLMRYCHRKFYFRSKYIFSRLFVRGFYHTNGRPIPPLWKIRRMRDLKILLGMTRSLFTSFVKRSGY